MGRPSREESERKQRILSDKELAFCIWSATPSGAKVPKTRDELAVALGVSKQTLWRWSKDPRLVDATRYLILQASGSPEKVEQVLDMLHEVALEKKDARVAEVWLKAVGVMQAHSARDASLWDAVTEEALDALSDEALEQLRLAKELELAEREQMAKAKAALADTVGG